MEQRYKNFDYLRGLAIAAVVLIHLTAPTALAEESGGIILNQVTRFGVPVFVFLSGWGLTIAESYERSTSYINFLKKRLAKLIPAYFVWNIIYYLFATFIEDQSIPIVDFIKGLFLGTNYPHLYFVPLIVLFYIAYPLLMKLGDKLWGVGLTFAITLISLITNPTIAGDLTQNQNPLNWLFYFVFGIWIAQNYEELKNSLNKYWVIGFLAVSTLYIILEPMGLADDIILVQTRPSILIFSILIILLNIVYSNWLQPFSKILNPLSDYSYPIYLSHYIFIRLFRFLFPTIPIFILFLLILISSIGLGILEEKVVR